MGNTGASLTISHFVVGNYLPYVIHANVRHFSFCSKFNVLSADMN
jgi:hypothetical protein